MPLAPHPIEGRGKEQLEGGRVEGVEARAKERMEGGRREMGIEGKVEGGNEGGGWRG